MITCLIEHKICVDLFTELEGHFFQLFYVQNFLYEPTAGSRSFV